MVTEQPVVCSGRNHTAVLVLHMHDAISLDAEWPDTRVIQRFTGHRLDRISPYLCDLHGMNSFDKSDGLLFANAIMISL
jgi:hypothetical protein